MIDLRLCGYDLPLRCSNTRNAYRLTEARPSQPVHVGLRDGGVALEGQRRACTRHYNVCIVTGPLKPNYTGSGTVHTQSATLTWYLEPAARRATASHIIIKSSQFDRLKAAVWLSVVYV